MTPKEKAKELCKKYFRTGHNIDYEKEKQYSKLNALICVDEIINSNPQEIYEEIVENEGYKQSLESSEWFWKEVKKEIENL